MSLSSAAKHIVFLTPGFAANTSDSTTIPALQFFLKAYLAKHPDRKVSIITLHFPFAKGSYYWHGATVYSLGASNSGFPKRFIYWKRMLQLLNKIHKENTIDNLHSFWLAEVAMLGERFAQKHGLLHTVTLMGQDVLKSNKYFYKTKVPFDRMIALTENQQAVLNENFNSKATTVIPWGTPNEFIVPAQVKQFDVINVGSLTQLKNQELFLDIVHELKTYNSQITAVIVGQGPDLQKLKSKCELLGLAENVTFTGGLSHAETLLKISASKVMVHTSSYESFGFVFNEAIINKVPIVSMQIGLAQESSFWKIAKNKMNFVNNINEFLKNQNGLFENHKILGMEETVKGYETLWQNKGRT